MPDYTAQTPLQYLKNQLKFGFAEWGTLTEKDKADLKVWAEKEMRVLGLEIK